ncbi:MAG: erythromycin esterase family protein, partial [Polyangiaceae bacterium]|nr:erythromycin esterase family protein [Polyangiaceae bacterium]
DDYDALLDRVGDARFVLIGEASHGTREFYRERARITKRLLLERGFHAVAIEGDWPDAYRVHRYVRGRGGDRSAREALLGFRRFPTFMWRNTEVLAFVEWLHARGRDSDEQELGFYGLDLYSLYGSVASILGFLDTRDPAAANRARERYECLAAYEGNARAYIAALGASADESCEDAVIEQLVELRALAAEAAARDGDESEEQFFDLLQNARLVKNAEQYYREMYLGGISTWNLRDTHMVETLEAVVAHLARRGIEPKVVVWAHNSHLGDARATAMGEHGELNVGQLVRERYGAESVLIGLTTYDGHVTAASRWDGAAQRMRVRPALAGSHEALLHRVGLGAFYLRTDDPAVARELGGRRLERAIGVIYRPA